MPTWKLSHSFWTQVSFFSKHLFRVCYFVTIFQESFNEIFFTFFLQVCDESSINIFEENQLHNLGWIAVNVSPLWPVFITLCTIKPPNTVSKFSINILSINFGKPKWIQWNSSFEIFSFVNHYVNFYLRPEQFVFSQRATSPSSTKWFPKETKFWPLFSFLQDFFLRYLINCCTALGYCASFLLV